MSKAVDNAPYARSLWVIGHLVTPIRVGERIVAIDGITPAGVDGPPPHRHEDRWKHKISGEPAVVKMVHVWTLNGGKAVAFQQHVDTARVLELS